MNKKVIEKIISILLITVFCLNFILPTNISMAETEETLITVGTGSYEISVTTTTKISEISNKLGNPKIVTPSAFGGHAYTFYTDSNYSNYLYVETTKNDEKIISAGSVDPSFKTSKYNYGDSYDYRDNRVLGGMAMQSDGGVKAYIVYDRNGASDTINTFKNNYLSNPIYYLKGMAEQATTMYNAFSTVLGNKTELVFNEEYFYINEQLKELGTDIRNYQMNMARTQYSLPIRTMEKVDFVTSNRWILNPLQWAKEAANQQKTKFENRNICIVDYNVDTKIAYIGTTSPELFKEKRKIELTSDEKRKLESGRAEYIKAIDYIEKDEDDMFAVQPQYETPEGLVAGDLKQSQKDGALAYMNAIRVAAGMGKLKWNDKAYVKAQHKATILAYRQSKLGLTIAHSFPKPEGVADDFYHKSLGENSNGTIVDIFQENCSRGQAGIIGDIKGYLDDSNNLYGLNMGHRHNIICPDMTSTAVGMSGITGAQEFSWNEGSPEPQVVAAWPSNGITFMETLQSNKFYWSAKFCDKYLVTDTTKIKVTCLNTDETWEFNEESESSKHYMDRYTNGGFNTVSVGNQLVWKDDTLVANPEYVYKIEISNLKNAETNKLETYTYRSVFKYAKIESENQKNPTKTIKIQVPETIEKSESGAYIIPDDIETKLGIKIDETQDKAVRWESSNPAIVEVTQNGTLKVKQISETPVTITVYPTSDHSIKDTIKVVTREVKRIPEGYKLKLNHSQYQLNNKNETVKLSDEYIEANQIKWSSSNPEIAKVDANGNVTAVSGGFAYITAQSNYGTDKCWVYVCMLRTMSDGRRVYPGDLDGNGVINSNDAALISDLYNSNITADETAAGDVNGDGVVNSNDVTEVLDKAFELDYFKPGEYTPITSITINKTSITLEKGDTAQLSATYSPTNTTDSPKLRWYSSNKAVATVDSNGKITAIGGGTATITASSSSGTKATCAVKVNEPVTPSPSPSTNPTPTTTPTVSPTPTVTPTVSPTITPSPTPTPTPTPDPTPTFKLGDVNADGKVNARDAKLVLQYFNGKATLTAEQRARADINKDGKINARDAKLILQIFNGKQI